MSNEGRLPKCGLYRTTKPLPGDENAVPANRLVKFHGHAGDAPHVVLPVDNRDNTWRFASGGIVVRDEDWPLTLEPLLPEGFYALTEHFLFDGGWWPKGTLVQLGYTRSGEACLFVAQRLESREKNELVFAERGVKLPYDKFDTLMPLIVRKASE